jgi:hypothetical protein
MKIRTKMTYPLAPAMLVVLALSGGVAGALDMLVPFNGSLQGNESPGGPDGGLLIFNGTGGGIANQLGRFTGTWTAKVDPTNCTGKVTFHFIAANGDSIESTANGTCEPASVPGVFHITEVATITAGTGRFAHAKGSFVVDRLTDLNTGLTSGSIHGSITSPGAN